MAGIWAVDKAHWLVHVWPLWEAAVASDLVQLAAEVEAGEAPAVGGGQCEVDTRQQRPMEE